MALKAGGKIIGEGKAKVFPTQFDAFDRASLTMRSKAAPDSFYFRKFRHVVIIKGNRQSRVTERFAYNSVRANKCNGRNGFQAMAVDNATSFGFRAVGAEEKQGMVDEVFHSVAQKYDVMNDVMSAGVHRIWKDAMVSALNPPKKGTAFRHLDVAGGTGDIAFRVAERSSNHVRSTVFDINASMLAVGADRAEKKGLSHIDFMEGNAEELPFEPNTFDAYTIAFGIRNVPQIDKALSEAYRVLKRGGRFLCLEFSTADVPGFDKFYEAYSFNVIPRMGEIITGDRDSYQYLVESIRKFPNPERFAAMIRRSGFEQVSYRAYTGGIVCLHSGWKL